MHVCEAPGDFGGNVQPRDGFADDGVAGRIFPRRLRIDLQCEGAVTDDLRVSDAASVGFDAAVTRDGVLPLRAQFFCAFDGERFARRGRGLAYLHAAVLDGEAAEGDALVRRQQRVALHDGDAVERYRQLFGGDLGHRGADAGAEVHLAGEHQDVAVGVDGKKAVDLVGGDCLAGKLLRILHGRRAGTCRERTGKREGDDERTGGL